MRYTIEKENLVKQLAKEGRSLDYISSYTEIPNKVIWGWCPELRPHNDIIRQSVKQRFYCVFTEYEAKISSAFSDIVRKDITDVQWNKANKVIYDTFLELSEYIFLNAIQDPPTFSGTNKLSDVKFLDYIKLFWDYENSPYVKERAFVKPLKKEYVEQCRNTVHFWSPLKNKLMRDITKGDVEIIHEKLQDKKLSSSRIAFILNVGLIPLEYAYKNNETLLKTYEYPIPARTKKDYSISSELLAKVFNEKWNNFESYTANLVAYYAGLTFEETKNLKLKDIYTDGGLKVNGIVKNIPIFVCDVLTKYASTSPYKDFKPTDYVFYSSQRSKHSSGYKWSDDLKAVFHKYSNQNISFNYWCKISI